MNTRSLYYVLKPCIPRPLQLGLRKAVIATSRRAKQDVWPIDERAAVAPADWRGWAGEKRFSFVLTHDVETARGQAKCKALAQLEESLGFRSSFNFVPERYAVSRDLRHHLDEKGFEIGVHGLNHDGRLFSSRAIFDARAPRINHYLHDWNAVGFRAPSMHHNLEWTHALDIEYDASTFDTDPFEPQPVGLQTIFPRLIARADGTGGYAELPYTLPQDFTLLILMREPSTDIWKEKLAWIAEHGGMALLNAHPDYMRFGPGRSQLEEYPVELYEEFLQHVRIEYGGSYWHALPREVARHVAAGRSAPHLSAAD